MSGNETIGSVKLIPVDIAELCSYVSVQLLVQGLHRQPKLFNVLFKSVWFVILQPKCTAIRETCNSNRRVFKNDL